MRDKGLRKEGTHPSFKASKADAAEDKETPTQSDTLWAVHWIRKEVEPRRTTDRETRVRE